MDIVACIDFYVGAVIFKLWVTILHLFAKKNKTYENDEIILFYFASKIMDASNEKLQRFSKY